MLTREEKKAQVEGLRSKLRQAEAAFLADYQGLKVSEMTQLRGSLRGAGVELRIMRNTLARLSVKDTPFEALSEHLTGPMAVALCYKDSVLAAKTLVGFANDQPNLKLKVGILGGKIIDVFDIKSLAELLPKNELLARFTWILKCTPAQLVGVLSGVTRKFLHVLDAIKNAKGG